MSLVYQPANMNIALLSGQRDKIGDFWMKLKAILVATGRWRVGGSSSGAGNVFQNRGQTAGVGGSAPWDVLTATAGGNSSQWATGGANSISNTSAWFWMEELDGVGVPTGRIFWVKRATNASSGVNTHRCSHGFVIGAMATSGATASNLPVPSGVTIQFCGSSLQDSSTGDWLTVAQDNTTSLNYDTITDNLLSVALEDDPGSRNVMGFRAHVWAKTANQQCAAFQYIKVSNTVAAELHPIFVSTGSWTYSHGNPMLALGPFHSSVRTAAGSALAAASFNRQQALAWHASAVVPGTVAPPARSDGTQLLRPVEVWNALGQFGALADEYPNPYNRNWPTTYGVATPSARVTLGQMIVKWPQNAVPQAGP